MSTDMLTVANPGLEKRMEIERDLGVRTVADAASGMPARCIILAAKPAKVPEVAASLVDAGIDASTLVVSIAAGVATSKLASMLGNDIPIVRVMPNTPLVCGCGMSAVSAVPRRARRIASLSAHSSPAWDAPSSSTSANRTSSAAVSGVGPAYFELFAETIAQSAVELGMDYEDALQLVMQTMLGTARLVIETGQSLPDAIDAVSSPGGTTVAALDAMREAGLQKALRDGVKAAARRSKELGA